MKEQNTNNNVSCDQPVGVVRATLHARFDVDGIGVCVIFPLK